MNKIKIRVVDIEGELNDETVKQALGQLAGVFSQPTIQPTITPTPIVEGTARHQAAIAAGDSAPQIRAKKAKRSPKKTAKKKRATAVKKPPEPKRQDPRTTAADVDVLADIRANQPTKINAICKRTGKAHATVCASVSRLINNVKIFEDPEGLVLAQ